MKVLSGPEGDGLLTNAEVQAWLKEKNFEIDKRELKAGQIRPASSIANLSRDVRQYLESSPSGTQTVAHVKELYEKLEQYKLSAPEKQMIANIRPEAYAHLTPLIMDVYSRFDEDQLYEMLEVINSTLPKRKKLTGQDEAEEANNDKDNADPERESAEASVRVDAMAFDISGMAVSQKPGQNGVAGAVTQAAAVASTAQDATIIDISPAVTSDKAQSNTPRG